MFTGSSLLMLFCFLCLQLYDGQELIIFLGVGELQ
jgi:hypothetical protein